MVYIEVTITKVFVAPRVAGKADAKRPTSERGDEADVIARCVGEVDNRTFSENLGIRDRTGKKTAKRGGRTAKVGGSVQDQVRLSRQHPTAIAQELFDGWRGDPLKGAAGS